MFLLKNALYFLIRLLFFYNNTSANLLFSRTLKFSLNSFVYLFRLHLTFLYLFTTLLSLSPLSLIFTFILFMSVYLSLIYMSFSPSLIICSSENVYTFLPPILYHSSSMYFLFYFPGSSESGVSQLKLSSTEALG